MAKKPTDGTTFVVFTVNNITAACILEMVRAQLGFNGEEYTFEQLQSVVEELELENNLYLTEKLLTEELKKLDLDLTRQGIKLLLERKKS